MQCRLQSIVWLELKLELKLIGTYIHWNYRSFNNFFVIQTISKNHNHYQLMTLNRFTRNLFLMKTAQIKCIKPWNSMKLMQYRGIWIEIFQLSFSKNILIVDWQFSVMKWLASKHQNWVDCLLKFRRLSP